MQTATRKNRRTKKRFPNWPLRWIVLGGFSTLATAAFVLPALSFRADKLAYESGRWDVFLESMLTNVMAWFVGLWIFFFGACLGSFLNVVAYRLPHRLTLLGSSRCPYCYVPIEARHNIPILGWFSLRGRCAACRLPISPRYFIVEIIAGILLVWIFSIEFSTGGTNLPGNQDFQIKHLFRSLFSGRLEDMLPQNWSLIRIFFIHCLVGYTILTAALMAWDRLSIPLYWQIAHLFMVLAVIGIWPGDFLINRWPDNPTQWFSGGMQQVGMPIFGGTAGFLLGKAFTRVSKQKKRGLGFSFCLLGVSLGLPAMLSAGLLFIFVATLMSGVSLREKIWSFPLFGVLLSFLLQVWLWSRLDSLWFWPTSQSPPAGLLAIAGIEVLLVYLLSHAFTNRHPSNKSPELPGRGCSKPNSLEPVSETTLPDDPRSDAEELQ